MLERGGIESIAKAIEGLKIAESLITRELIGVMLSPFDLKVDARENSSMLK